MAGTITVGTISDGTNSGSATDAIKGSARAWVNFNGTGTIAIRASYNVSSLTDNGTASYTVNFTTAMPDANYAAVGSTSGENYAAHAADLFNTSYVRVRHMVDYNHNWTDGVYNCTAIFR